MNKKNYKNLIKKKIIIHIGLHKTATSFFQSEVFPNLDNILFLGNVGTADLERKNNISNSLEHDMSDEIMGIMEKNISSVKLNKIKSKFNMVLKEASMKNKKILISAESLSFTKSLEIKNVRNKNKISIHLACKRLKYIFNDPIIWVNIRKAKSLAWSTYMYFIRQGKYIDFETFWKECYVNEITDWTSMIDIYKARFSKKSLLITSYEQLKKEPHIFWKDLSKIFNTDFEKILKNTKNKIIFQQSNARIYKLQKYLPFFYFITANTPQSLKKILKKIVSYKAKKTLPSIPKKIEKKLKDTDIKNSQWLTKNFNVKY